MVLFNCKMVDKITRGDPDGSAPKKQTDTKPSKPRGPVPKGMEWDEEVAKWVKKKEVLAAPERESDPLSEPHGEEERGEEAEWAGRSCGGARKFRQLWKSSLSCLECVKDASVDVCPSEAGSECSGCKDCSTMWCA